MQKIRPSSLLFVCGLVVALPATAESAVRKTMDFAVTADVGFGNEVCVMGAHPLLGAGNPLLAPKLTWTPGNVWRGKIAMEAGTTFNYQFISRSFATADWANTANSTLIGNPLSIRSPAHVPPPWGGKCIIYRSTFFQPRIRYRDVTHGGAWTERAMWAVGPGRTPAEQTFRVDQLAPSGSELEFVFHNGSGSYDNSPAPPSGAAPYAGLGSPFNYRTALDVFVVQDKSIFNDFPPASPVAPRIETRQVASTVAGIPGRAISILLPRGYAQNERKRYPVVYFHDGQNVFFPGGPFGTWDADRIAGYETSQGRMREAILVAVSNTSARLREYLPDGDTLFIGGTSHAGNADAYSRFLIENVIPVVDANYRTLTDAAQTLTAGSSLGGLVSDYLGFSHPGRFGGIGIFSPAYWAAPQWVARRDAAGKLPLRRYLSMGTAEAGNSNGYWRDALQAYDGWSKAGHAVNDDLRFEGGAGEAHNEPAWSRRLPGFFAFALDPWREANPLAQELFPPAADLTRLDFPAGEAVIRYTGLLGTRQTMQHGSDLGGWGVRPLPPESELWETREAVMPLLLPFPSSGFWRLKQEVRPAGP